MRDALTGQLPSHMVPGRIIALDRMPLTPNRKVDRKQLPSPAMVVSAPVVALAAVAPVVAPAAAATAKIGNLSQAVLGIWCETLGVPQVGPRDNFFALGGHSLLAIQLHRTLRDRLGLARLGVTDIFRFPVFDAFQKHVAKLAPAEATGGGVDAAPMAQTPVVATPQAATPVTAAPPVAAEPATESAIERRRALRAQLRRNG